MAFTIASGIDPEYGLYSAIIAGGVAAILGGSELNITGPAGALIGVLLGVVTAHGYADVLVVSMLAGAILVFAGVAGLGRLVQYVPVPVIIGFTGGIGVIILMSQLPEALGITDLPKHPYLHQKLAELFGALDRVSGAAIGITVLTIATIEGGRRFVPDAAAPIVGITAATLVAILTGADIRTIESAYGAIPESMPGMVWPEMTLDKITTHIGSAAVVAALVSLETLLSATASDGMTGKRHNSNAELVGCGVANMVAPLFGGIPVCGAIARTTLNARSGAQTRVAALFNAFALLLVMLFLAPVVGQIPLAALGGLLVYVAIRMIEVRTYKALLDFHHWTDFAMFAATLFLTIFINLTVGISCGLAMAGVAYFMRGRTSAPKVVESAGTDDANVGLVDVGGPLFFHTARSVVDRVTESEATNAIIIALQIGAPVDASGVAALKDIVENRAGTRQVFIAGTCDVTRELLAVTGVTKLVGEGRVFGEHSEALEAAENVG